MNKAKKHMLEATIFLKAAGGSQQGLWSHVTRKKDFHIEHVHHYFQ